MPRSSDNEMLLRLDQILRVLALQVGAEKSATERVWLLKLAGIDNRTIAEVLNLSEATVRTLAFRVRDRKMGRKRKKVRRS